MELFENNEKLGELVVSWVSKLFIKKEHQAKVTTLLQVV